MKKIFKMYWKRVVSSILAVTMLCTSVSLEAFATENIAVTQNTEDKSQNDEYQIRKEDVIEEKNTEDSTTYDTGEGTYVTEYYAQPVRYEDEDGELVDYDPSLVEIKKSDKEKNGRLKNYSYKNKRGDKKHYFPNKLTKETPILMENEELQIKFAPAEDELTEEVQLQTEEVTDIYAEESFQDIKTLYSGTDGKIDYQYTSFEQGVKEEIILNEKPDTNQFTFSLEIPGMFIRENRMDNGLTIYKGEDIVAGIQSPFMNDATENAYSEELSYSLETIDKEAGLYNLILTVDEEYLENEERVYPITIDPTFTWNTNTKISDVYVLSEYPSYNYYDTGITSFYVGYGSQGKSRAFIKFAGMSGISGKYVKKATLTLHECTSSLSGKKVSAHRIIESWNKTEICWDDRPTFKSAAIANLTTEGSGGTPTMDLTTLIRGYANGTYTNYGIVLKNNNETSSSYFTKFYGARHATTSYRPKLTVEYYTKPTTATTVSATPKYIKPGASTTVKWAGITSSELSYVNYRLAEYDKENSKEIEVVKAYSTSTKLGTTASGSKTLVLESDVPSGTYKTYRLSVRGVGKSGATGSGKSSYFTVDNAKPTGTIKVLAAGTAESTTVLRDTVQIVGEVDGTGSPIKTSSMKLYDESGNFVENIYTNATQSKVTATYTGELENGDYILKLSMTDSAGNTATVSKSITVLNKVPAPILEKVVTNNQNASIAWEIPDNGTTVKGLAYKLSTSSSWTEVNDISGRKGILNVTIPETEGTYSVSVCGIDELGTYGATSTVTCEVDKTVPEVQIHSTDKGLIYATVTDKNLSDWVLMLREKGSTTETEISTGNNTLQEEYLGFFNRSQMEVGIEYELVLTGTDKAGNKNSVIVEQSRTADEAFSEQISEEFIIKRPTYMENSERHIVFPANISKLELESSQAEASVPEGTTRWYLDGSLVNTGTTWENNLPTEEGKSHSVLTVIEGADEVYYSAIRIKNYQAIPVNQGIEELPENCVALCLNSGEDSGTVQIRLDGEEENISLQSGQTYHIVQLTDGKKATASTIQIVSATGEENGQWNIETDTVFEETFELSSIENYHPYEATIKDKLNYKTYLKWQGIEGEWPENISYEIYRSTEEDVEITESNLVAKDIKANYWAEMNINYSHTFYYKIRAVEKDEKGNVINASISSHEISSKVIDVDEYVKRMGIKEYWEYAEFETPSGNGYIEKSKGNLAYTQVDTEIPNEQLPVVLERTYNSQSSAKTAFGIGWTHSFDLELINICKDNSLEFNNIVFKDGNGTIYLFDKADGDKGIYTSSMGKYVTLTKEEKTEKVKLPETGIIGVENKTKEVEVISSFTMTTKDNVEYRYNSSGQLIYMEEANGNFLLFEYDQDKGVLSRVRTSKNLVMEFVYFTDDDYVSGEERPDLLTIKEIRLPDGSKVSYHYEKARLTGVTKLGTDGSSKLEWSLVYDDDLQLVEISDACQNMYKINYENEKAVKVTYPNEEAIALEYRDDGSTAVYKEVKENDSIERILLETNTFEKSSGNSLTMTDSYGNSVNYEYTDNLRSKEIYSMTYYTVEGNQIVEKTTTKTDTTKYSDDENITEEVDEDGITTKYEYNTNASEELKHLPVSYKEIDKENKVITYETYVYDSYGNLIKRTDMLSGLVVETEYYTEDDSSSGKLKGEIKSEVEYYLEDSGNSSSSESKYTYNSKGEKTEVITEKSGQYEVTTTNVYDVMGRLKSSKDTLGTETINTFDPFGRVIKVTVKQGDITDVVTREYDANGTLIKEVAEDNTIYSYTYDNMNRVISESVNSDTWTTEYSYGSVDIHTGKGIETVEHVLITTEKNPDGKILAITYTDTLGRTVRQMQGGLYTDYTYDREDHVITSCQLGIDPENENPVITVNLYDEKGNMTGQVLRPGYDEATGCFTVEDDSLTQSAVYDSTGNVISATDGMGNTTSYTYDAYGRIETVTLPAKEGENANVTSYEYDKFTEEKNGTTQNIVKDALGRTSVTTYNMAMQVISVSDKGDGNIDAINQTYSYDSKGRTSVIKDSLGNTTNYTYDGKDRVTKVSYKNTSGTEVLRTCYTYDKSDNVVSMLDYKVSDGTATQYRYTGFTYDHHKRLTSLVEINTSKAPSALTEEERAQHTTSYSYDKDGNLLTVTYPESDWNVKSLSYVYDDANKWLMAIKANVVADDGTQNENVLLREYVYDEYGDVSEIKDYRVLSETGAVIETPEYTSCSYEYDEYRRPITMEYTDSTDPDTVKEAYTYKYDKNSRLIEETLQNLYPSKAGDCQNEKRTYSYDVYGNLVKTDIVDLLDSSASHTLTYTYDAVGNRLTQSKTIGDATEKTTYTYNSLNQMLTSKTTAANGTVKENKTYTYDKNGNQIQVSDSVSNTVTTSTYDPKGQLSKYVKKENGTTTLTQTNKYNGAGARIQKTENGESINYFYSQGGVLYTTDGEGKDTAFNLMGVAGNVIATARNENDKESYYYYHKDPAGSISNLRDADGASVVSYQYTDFGETSIYGDTDFYNEICYNESIYDKNTGLYYLNARYYNPEDGRFLTRDSYRGNAARPSTLHLYAYCANNPINYEDPSGHIAISRIVGGIVGAIAGGFIGSKIAKKTNAKGWKKVAIIAGCALAGGAVGAIAGPKVAKVAKKAATYVKRKLPSKKQVYSAAKKTVSKAKSSVKKVTTKTKNVISSAKSKTTNIKNRVKTTFRKKSSPEPVNIELKYKDGWTAAQRAEADAKVKALSNARTVKTPVNRSGTSASVRYKRVFGKDAVPQGYDVDHIIDLQLGGVDDIINMNPLDRSVNRSLGAQIMNAIKDYPKGTVFGIFTIG